jgi:putative endonuclease
MTWTVYMVQTASGKLYTGITTDMDRRFREHASGNRGGKFFRFSGPARVVYRETAPDRSAASAREAEIKKLTRRQKLDLAGS